MGYASSFAGRTAAQADMTAAGAHLAMALSDHLASHYPSHPAPLKVPLMVFPEHACVYLPGRNSTSRGFVVGEMPGGIYHRFMDAGFRRSGKLVYQPVCAGCRACVSLRVPVEGFQPGKSQGRCVRRNGDLLIPSAEPVPTQEKFDLY